MTLTTNAHGSSGIIQFLEEETTCSIAQQARSVRGDRHESRKSQELK
jgi:hypothetical protein